MISLGSRLLRDKSLHRSLSKHIAKIYSERFAMKKPFTFNLSGPLLFVNEATFTTFFGVQNYNIFQ